LALVAALGLGWGLAPAQAEEPPIETPQVSPTLNVTDNGVTLTVVDPESDTAIDEQAGEGTLVGAYECLDIEEFSLVALTWAEAEGAPVLYLRTHSADGWSQWYTFSTTDDVIVKNDGTFSSDAIWVGDSDGLQVQAIGDEDSSISDLQAVVIEPGAGPRNQGRAGADIAPASTTISNFLDAPAFQTRAQWGAAAPDCKTTVDATVIAITVHHTAGSNVYTQAEAPGIVRGIQAYHQSLEWCDIGYNFLIDKFGTIYEGHYGGADLPVHGAHAGTWNLQTVGISFMMNSETAEPTPVALEAAEHLIAWKLQSYYRNPLGTVSIGGKTLATIFKHQDVSATACPGKFVIAKMEEIRHEVVALMAGATASPIQPKWQSLGGATGTLGQPYRLEQPIGNGRYTEFKNGSIYWTSTTDAHTVTGSIATAFLNAGGALGNWGFPLTDAYTNSSGQLTQQFQNGWATVPSGGGAVTFAPGTPPSPNRSVTYTAHVQSFGWMASVKDGATAGTIGKSKRLEAFTIALPDAPTGSSVTYSADVQTLGWMASVTNGKTAGTTGKGRRIEGIKISLSGPIANTHSVWYRVHVQSRGWLGWTKDGQPAGTQGYGYRIEAIQISLEPVGTAPSPLGGGAYLTKAAAISYSAHVASQGWLPTVSDGATAGTTGKARRMEALQLTVQNLPAGSGVSVAAHVQSKGWMAAVSNGKIAGTTGKSLRMEALKITLTGPIASTHDIWYRAHVQGYGWLAWTSNGNPAGSQGRSLRMEAVQILLLPKGTPPPQSTATTAFVTK
jgi:uncharacterized protein YjdB